LWSCGEVTSPNDYSNKQLPFAGGLADPVIFGHDVDYECRCGKYKRIRYRGVVCDRCGVEVSPKSVRYNRFGHITLPLPVAHPLLAEPCTSLDFSSDRFAKDLAQAKVDVEQQLWQQGYGAHQLLTAIPVLPIELRPYFLDEGKVGYDGLNYHYSLLITRVNRIKSLIKIGAPAVIMETEYKLLQEAVSNLYCLSPDNITLASRLEHLAKKIYREPTIASAMSLVVPDANLALDEISLPRNVAIDCFDFQLMQKLRQDCLANALDQEIIITFKGIRHVIVNRLPIALQMTDNLLGKLVLVTSVEQTHFSAFKTVINDDEVIKMHPLAIQALYPETSSIPHALVHVPLTTEAQDELKSIVFAGKARQLTDGCVSDAESMFQFTFDRKSKRLSFPKQQQPTLVDKLLLNAL
jgi:DNA-directed RNA polymerase beta' subunit